MRQLYIRIVIFYFITQMSLFSQDPLVDAQQLIDKKQYEKAYLIAQDLLKKDSANVALKILIQLQFVNYLNKDVYESTGDAYQKLGVNELSIVNYEKAEALDTTDINLKYKIAELLSKEKRYKDAINKYLNIISLSPMEAKAYLNVASILYQAKLYADAAVMFEKYLGLERNLNAYRKITNSLLEIKYYEKVYNYAREGLSLYPDDLFLKKNLAIASFALKKYDEAAQNFSSLPDSILNLNDYLNTAYSFVELKQDTNAIHYFEKALQLDSNLTNVYLELANIYFKIKNYDQAIKYYKVVTERDSEIEFAHRFLGYAYYQIKNYEEAYKTLLKATSLNDTILMTHYFLAQIYKNLDSIKQAINEYKKFLSLCTDKNKTYEDQIIEANYFIGQRAFIDKNYSLAIQYLLKVSEYKPNDISTLEMLGLSYHQLKKNDNAIKIYKRLQKLDPNNEIAKKGLRMLSAD